MRRTSLAPRAVGHFLSARSLRRFLPLAMIGAALALSACTTQSPVQTDVPYVAADGVPVDLGPVQLRNLLVISSAKDKPGVLSAAASNTSDSVQRVAFALPSGTPVYTTVPPHSEQQLSSTTQLQLSSVPVAPGAVVQLTVQSPSAPTTVVTVPVLAPSGYYATLGATAAPSSTTTAATTASPTTTATP